MTMSQFLDKPKRKGLAGIKDLALPTPPTPHPPERGLVLCAPCRKWRAEPGMHVAIQQIRGGSHGSLKRPYGKGRPLSLAWPGACWSSWREETRPPTGWSKPGRDHILWVRWGQLQWELRDSPSAGPWALCCFRLPLGCLAKPSASVSLALVVLSSQRDHHFNHWCCWLWY